MKKFLMIAVVAILLASCATAVTIPITATSNPIGSKVGVAKAEYVVTLGFITPDWASWEVTADKVYTADIGILKAAKNGGITKIATVDSRVTNKCFRRIYETIVTGE